ncbi:MAG: DUF2218 domain-containing protein [Nocardioidaceae bacterium]
MRPIHEEGSDERGRPRRRGADRERHAGQGHPRRRGRASRGDVRTAVLQLLADEPMHGYQLMQAIAERTGGRWAPSPGAIYPTINQLEDEGLVIVEMSSGRRLVSLTDAGRAQVDADRDAGREPFASFEAVGHEADLRGLLGELQSAVRQVGRSGSDAQRRETARLLAEARKSIYLLLADEGTSTSGALVARASVPTSSAERYLKQLAAHLGRRSEVREEAGGTRIILAGGDCLLTATAESLDLAATADSEEALDGVTDVVGSHLERFGQRNELAVTWQRG